MASFREHTPRRQKKTNKVADHKEHIPELRKDFKSRCGYCDDVKIGNAVFEVDHFVPQNPKNFTTTIDPTDYSNLVYSCMSCNRAKSNKWPTDNEKIRNKNNEGFIDPCDEEYDKQFKRTDDGRILPDSELGKWMYYSLKLHKPQHEILWKLDQLEKTKNEILEFVKKNPTDDKNVNKLVGIYESYDEYMTKLANI